MQPTDLAPHVVVKRVRDLLKKLVVVPGKDDLSREAQENATLMFSMLARATLASKPVVMKHRLSIKAFDWLLGDIELRFNQAMAAAGAFVVFAPVDNRLGGLFDERRTPRSACCLACRRSTSSCFS